MLRVGTDHDRIALGVEACPTRSATHLLVPRTVHVVHGDEGGLEDHCLGWQVDSCTKSRSGYEDEKDSGPVTSLYDLFLVISESGVVISYAIFDHVFQDVAEAGRAILKFLNQVETLFL